MIVKLKHGSQIPFTQIPNTTIQDAPLSPTDLGVLVYLLSLPEDWHVRQKHVAQRFDVGMHTIRKTFANLKKLGFLEHRSHRDDEGKITSHECIVYHTSTVSNIHTVENQHSGESTRWKIDTHTNKQCYKQTSVTNKDRSSANALARNKDDEYVGRDDVLKREFRIVFETYERLFGIMPPTLADKLYEAFGAFGANRVIESLNDAKNRDVRVPTKYLMAVWKQWLNDADVHARDNAPREPQTFVDRDGKVIEL